MVGTMVHILGLGLGLGLALDFPCKPMVSLHKSKVDRTAEALKSSVVLTVGKVRKLSRLKQDSTRVCNWISSLIDFFPPSLFFLYHFLLFGVSMTFFFFWT